jgi:hypothetical protein
MLNYFLYKNEIRNCWSEMTEKHSHFYVGFGDEWSKGHCEARLPTKEDRGDKRCEQLVGDLRITL